jgi:hypothetical protein
VSGEEGPLIPRASKRRAPLRARKPGAMASAGWVPAVRRRRSQRSVALQRQRAAENLTRNQVAVLNVLREEPQRVGELAKASGLSPAAAGDAARRLVAKGYASVGLGGGWVQ